MCSKPRCGAGAAGARQAVWSVAVLRYIALVIVGRALPAAVLSDPAQRALPATPTSPRPAWTLFPKTIHWENLAELFNDPSVNILARAAATRRSSRCCRPPDSLLLCSMAGYGLARIPYR